MIEYYLMNLLSLGAAVYALPNAARPFIVLLAPGFQVALQYSYEKFRKYRNRINDLDEEIASYEDEYYDDEEYEAIKLESLKKELDDLKKEYKKDFDEFKQKVMFELSKKEDIEKKEIEEFINNYMIPTRENLERSLSSYKNLEAFLKTLSQDDIKVLSNNEDIFKKVIINSDRIKDSFYLLMNSGFYPFIDTVIKYPNEFGVLNKLNVIQDYKTKLENYAKRIDVNILLEISNILNCYASYEIFDNYRDDFSDILYDLRNYIVFDNALINNNCDLVILDGPSKSLNKLKTNFKIIDDDVNGFRNINKLLNDILSTSIRN